jgi:ABC-type multidrug transport system fused ATPase/permease subunit
MAENVKRQPLRMHPNKVSVNFYMVVWLQNATIKNNILFGNAYDQQRYNAVIKYCALKRDLQVLEAGDNLEVGEKGNFNF